MGYYDGKFFPEMLTDLESAGFTAGTAAQLESWGENFVQAITEGRDSLGSSANGLRATWSDLAGDSFETRVSLAIQSMDPWAEWKLPVDDLNGLSQFIMTTRTTVEAAKAAYDQAQQALSTGYDSTKSLFDNVVKSLDDSGQGVKGSSDGQVRAAEAALKWARDAMDALDAHLTEMAGTVLTSIPTQPWNGPTGNVGGPTAPGNRNAGSNGPVGSDPRATPGGDQGTDPAADQAGQGGVAADAGGDAGEVPGDGTGLAGTPMPTMPTVPTFPTGPGTPPSMPLIPPPGGIPYPPLTPVKPFDPKGFKGGSGLGGSVIGRGGGGGGGYFGTGKHGLGGGLGKLDSNGTSGPAQAARQMGGRALPSVPEAPVLPASSGPAAGAAGGAAGSAPPPMMPPMGMGGGGNKPKPGTATPPMQGQGRSQNKLPGVPQKLRGRSGKSDPTSGPGAFGAAAAPRRRRSGEKELVDTVQLLDEELWAVEEPPAAPAAAPAPKRRLGGR